VFGPVHGRPGIEHRSVEGVDVDWQSVFFSISRYKQGEFFRGCGNVVTPFSVPTTATAVGFGPSMTKTSSPMTRL
jgi:hypothetical protein